MSVKRRNINCESGFKCLVICAHGGRCFFVLPRNIDMTCVIMRKSCVLRNASFFIVRIRIRLGVSRY